MMSNLYQLSPVFHRTKASDIGVVDSMAFAKAHMHMKRQVLPSQYLPYISRLEDETTFKEFKNVMEVVRVAISGDGKNKPLISVEDVKQIYGIIDSMKPLHGTGFDLFGAVYEMFASSKEKKDFGEYFTRRHYTHIFSKLLGYPCCRSLFA